MWCFLMTWAKAGLVPVGFNVNKSCFANCHGACCPKGAQGRRRRRCQHSCGRCNAGDKAKRDRNSQLTLLGCKTDVEGVLDYNENNGRGACCLASGDAMRLWLGQLGDGGREGDRTWYFVSIDVDMRF